MCVEFVLEYTVGVKIFDELIVFWINDNKIRKYELQLVNQ